MSDHVTIYTVAERAGVSISTVSLALNQPQRVSAATRDRVVVAAATLGYRSGHRSGGVGTRVRVAVAAPFSSYPSYLQRLVGVLDAAAGSAVEVVVEDLPSAAAADQPLLDALPFRSGVDGTILMGVPLTASAIRAAQGSASPVVLVDVTPLRGRRAVLPMVAVDDEAAGVAVAEHLIGLGHRRVGFLNEGQRSFDYISAGLTRVRGLLSVPLPEPWPEPPSAPILPLSAAEARHRLHVVDLHVESEDEIEERVLTAVCGEDPVTAVVANHDDLAASAHGALRRAGLLEQVSLVGHDDGRLADAIGLTTVRAPFRETGVAALGLLRRRLTHPDEATPTISMSPQLVLRDSTRPPVAGH